VVSRITHSYNIFFAIRHAGDQQKNFMYLDAEHSGVDGLDEKLLYMNFRVRRGSRTGFEHIQLTVNGTSPNYCIVRYKVRIHGELPVPSISASSISSGCSVTSPQHQRHNVWLACSPHRQRPVNSVGIIAVHAWMFDSSAW